MEKGNKMKKDKFNGVCVKCPELSLMDVKPKSSLYHIWYNIKELFTKKSEPITIVFLDKGDSVEKAKKEYPDAWIFENPNEILAACVKMNKTFGQFINDALKEGIKMMEEMKKREEEAIKNMEPKYTKIYSFKK
jgi:quinolinate synthase